MKTVCILGATGSIGTRALDFLRMHAGHYALSSFSVGANWQAAAAIAAEFGCRRVAVNDPAAARRLRDHSPELEVLDGPAGVVSVAGAGADVTLAAICGSDGLPSVLAAIRAGGQLALANKESLVCGGPELLALAKAHDVPVIPVDSEHSAIFQCLMCGRAEEVASITLTASGGPFRFSSLADMRTKTPAEALAHPNWPMGRKNSLDSATLANKGLELIEACYLFDVDEAAVEVLINPNSVFHSAVQFKDGSMIAQLGQADMRVPIGYALSWPERRETQVGPISLGELGKLEFWPPDHERFPSLELARAAVRCGQPGTLLFNAANEVAGQAFFDRRIGFMDIPAVIETCLDRGGLRFRASIEDAVAADGEAKAFCADILHRFEAAGRTGT
jgi:1-deoxy-D-xylulose-5-phosphate reductoisomerase